MKASGAFRGHYLHKKCNGKRTLRECTTSGKRDNIVLIEIDCDDLGDVIILDVPESFQEKFRKNAEHHVIEIDDDDCGESRDGACDMDTDATTSNGCSPTSAAPSPNCANMDTATESTRFPPKSAARSSNCADVDEDCLFVNEGNTPVKLSKSKRTYSGKARNRYGLSSDLESSSESDASDCEFVEDSCGKLREQWEKASFKRSRDTSSGYSDAENKVGTSAPNEPVLSSDDEAAATHAESSSEESNLNGENQESHAQKPAEESRFSRHASSAEDMDGRFTGRHDSCNGSSDFGYKDCAFAPDQPVHHGAEETAAQHTELPTEECCFKNSVNHDSNGLFGNSPEQAAEQSMLSQQYCDAKQMGKVFTGDCSTDVNAGAPNQDFEGDHHTFIDGEQDAGRPRMLSDKNSCGHSCEAKFADQNHIIFDREKIKETDEYKRAMEEEQASRQQQLQRQAEEAQRLRSRKRAQKMRIMVNEKRQKQRVEEIRETRRKDEENLNLKDKLRAEIKKELRKLETTCYDMASLLRSLGIHVGGGPFPSPHEVQVAYKRACLKFHPDRLSATDLRQQVEAEEKFKLISNMKEKFSAK